MENGDDSRVARSLYTDTISDRSRNGDEQQFASVRVRHFSLELEKEDSNLRFLIYAHDEKIPRLGILK